ncbi:hypothetical protein [Oscillibacter sp.]|uniref:hypothetical protein n=1 Tax=Oscillibacter sp. TaxID=1945593 RepID=UPI00339B0001
MKTKKSSIRKRELSLLLCLAMLFTLCIPAFAAEPVSGENKTESEMAALDAQIAQESEAYKQAEYKSIHEQLYVQLKEQNALDLLPKMQETIYASVEKEIDAFIAKKYGRSLSTQNTTTRNEYNEIYASNGGSLEYEEIDSSYDLKCAESYLDTDDTDQLLWDQATSFTLSDVLYTVLGYVPKVGAFFSLLSGIPTYTNKFAWQNVKDAGKHANIMNTESYDQFDGETTRVSVLLGWYSYPMMKYPTDVDSVSYTLHH